MNATPAVATTPVTFVVAPLTPRQQYEAGANAYAEGASYFDGTNAAWRKGWLAANNAAADCETEIYLRNQKRSR